MSVEIIETNLDFDSLSERSITDMIVLHHTGGNDIDADAYLHEQSVAKLLKKTAGGVTANVILSFLKAIPGIGDGLYESGKDLLDDIRDNMDGKKEKRRLDEK